MKKITSYKLPLTRKGFTLLEILVVVTVIGLFSGLSIAYYNTFTQEKLLETTAKNVGDVLELARKKAEAGDIMPNTGCTSFTGYQVDESSTAGKSYKINFCCSGVCNTVLQEYAVNPVVTVTIPSAITFKPLNAGIGTAVTITIKNTSLTKCIDIDVNTAGLIQVGDKYTTGC